MSILRNMLIVSSIWAPFYASAEDPISGRPVYESPDAQYRSKDMSNKRIINVAPPENPTDGANKAYVDQALGQTLSEEPGDNLGSHIAFQPLEMNGEPVQGLSSLRRGDASVIDMSQDEMVFTAPSGYSFGPSPVGINAGGNPIQYSGQTLLDSDPATKLYVDQKEQELRERFANLGVLSPRLALADIDPAILRQTIYSAPINIENLAENGTLSISGSGNPQLSVNGGPWFTNSAVSNNDVVQVRLTTGSTYSQTFEATVSLDGQPLEIWTVRTGASCMIELIGMQCPDGTAYAGRLSSGERWYMDNNSRDDNAIYAYASGSTATNDERRSTISGWANSKNANAISDGEGPHPAIRACTNRGPQWFLPSVYEFETVYENEGTYEEHFNTGINRFEGRYDGPYIIKYAVRPENGRIRGDNDITSEFGVRYWTSTEEDNSGGNGDERAWFLERGIYLSDNGVYATNIFTRNFLTEQPFHDKPARVRCGRVDSGVNPTRTAEQQGSRIDGGTPRASGGITVRIDD